jgi:hypothetical protein
MENYKNLYDEIKIIDELIERAYKIERYTYRKWHSKIFNNGYDEDGYDVLGYNHNNVDKDGYDVEGYDKYRLNRACVPLNRKGTTGIMPLQCILFDPTPG